MCKEIKIDYDRYDELRALFGTTEKKTYSHGLEEWILYKDGRVIAEASFYYHEESFFEYQYEAE